MKKPGGNSICLSPLTWSYWADPSGWTRWKKLNFSNSTEASVKRTRFLSGWPIAFFVAYLRPLAYDGVALNSCVVPPPEFCLSNIFACLFSLVLLNFEATGLMEVTINKKNHENEHMQMKAQYFNFTEPKRTSNKKRRPLYSVYALSQPVVNNPCRIFFPPLVLNLSLEYHPNKELIEHFIIE